MAVFCFRCSVSARTTGFLTLFAQIVFGLPCVAQDEPKVHITPHLPARRSAPAAIRVDVGLIQIPVTVTDTFNAPVLGLGRDTFRLFEDGIEQEVKYFTADDAPVSLGVVFDASRSMTGKLDQSRDAISRFFRTSMPGDEFFLVEFNDSPRILSRFTSDTVYIEKTLASIQPRNWTALFDAVYLSTQQMKHARNARKALLILSDGADNYSRYTESEMKSLVREADVTIYSIGLIGSGFVKHHIKSLRTLAAETGGHLHEVEKMEDLPDAVANISAAIRHQYVLGYSSNNPNNSGLYRKIEVKLNPRPDKARLHASWRMGYYSAAGKW